MSDNNIHARIRRAFGTVEDRFYFAGYPRLARLTYETWRRVRFVTMAIARAVA